MDRLGRVATAGATACAVALATRLPATTPTTLAALGFAAAALGFGVASCLSQRAALGPLAMAFAAALLVVPAGDATWLDLPAVVGAAPTLVFLHVLLRPHTATVPWLSGTLPGRFSRSLRLVPWLVLAIAAGSAPALAQALLPERIALSNVAQGPPGPIVAAAVLALGAVAVAMAARTVARRPRTTVPRGEK